MLTVKHSWVNTPPPELFCRLNYFCFNLRLNNFSHQGILADPKKVSGCFTPASLTALGDNAGKPGRPAHHEPRPGTDGILDVPPE
jgi:hypothetical protein